MSDTTELLDTTTRGQKAPGNASRSSGGLSGMVLPDLKAMASSMGIKGVSGLRKGDLIAAISAHQGGSQPAVATRAGSRRAAPADSATPAGSAAPTTPAGPSTGTAPAARTADTAPTNGTTPANGTAPSAGTAAGVDEQPRARRRAGRAAGAPAATDAASDAASATLFDADRPATAADGTRPTDDRSSDRPTDDRSADDRSTGRTQTDDQDPRSRRRERTGTSDANAAGGSETESSTTDRSNADRQSGNGDRADNARQSDQQTERGSDRQDGDQGERSSRRNRRNRRDRDRDGQAGGNQNGQGGGTQNGQGGGTQNGQGAGGQNAGGQSDQGEGDRQDRQRDNQNRQNTRNDRNDQNSSQDEDDDRGGRRSRYRDRDRSTRNRRGNARTDRLGGDPDTEIREDDVLLPVAGIVDVLDSYAFVRTSGYLSGPNDVYVSLSQVRKHGLRRGDHLVGAVRAPREGESQQRQKFNALVRIDTVNGLDAEAAKNRPEFTKLTPLYPNERLRLETEPHLLTTRVIDIVMPVGKGQRALIVAPPKAGKTMVMQAIANAIATNNPECHLMVVLVDERPEEVTDMQRSVKGEVIASTFDRPPADHTMVAELAIERAKRLVEMGRDVVVLLDSITRLGRAYNLAAPASGRILSGGVDSTALFPPKRFLGAARNIENGGSLTIFASTLVETGSAGDTVIFEEFQGTGNAALKLDRRLSDKRIFPAIDLNQSSTRKEDLLMSPDELAVVVKLRKVLGALDTQQALELVLDRLRKTRTNIEFLMQVAKNTPGQE